MFDIGFWEIALISILALVVIGPERLPGVARTMGRWFGKARRFVEGVKGEVESEFDTAELKRLLHNQEVQLKELQSKMNDEASDFRSGFSYNLEDENKIGGDNLADDEYLEFLDEDEEKDHEQIAAEKKLKEEQLAAREQRSFQNPAVESKPEDSQQVSAENESDNAKPSEHS